MVIKDDEMIENEEIVENWSEESSKIYNALSLPKKILGFLYRSEGQELGVIAKKLNMARTSFQRYIESYQHGELIKKGEHLGEYNITERGEALIKQMKQLVGDVLIKEHEKKHKTFCTTCSNAIDPYNTNNYTLIFGPDDFRKKGSFCGLDCLEYFLIRLKQMKRGGKNTD